MAALTTLASAMAVVTATTSSACASAENRTASATPKALVVNSAVAHTSGAGGRSDHSAETNASATTGQSHHAARTCAVGPRGSRAKSKQVTAATMISGIRAIGTPRTSLACQPKNR